jgi:hypothetical protein
LLYDRQCKCVLAFGIWSNSIGTLQHIFSQEALRAVAIMKGSKDKRKNRLNGKATTGKKLHPTSRK